MHVVSITFRILSEPLPPQRRPKNALQKIVGLNGLKPSSFGNEEGATNLHLSGYALEGFRAFKPSAELAPPVRANVSRVPKKPGRRIPDLFSNNQPNTGDSVWCCTEMFLQKHQKLFPTIETRLPRSLCK